MKQPYRYTWKNDITIRSNRAVGFPVALHNDMIFADLLTGDTYRVFSTFKAKENDRDNLDMPDDVVQTFSAKPLSREQMDALRARYKFQQDELTQPGLELVLLD